MSRACSKKSKYKLSGHFAATKPIQPKVITFDYIASVKRKSQLIYEKRIKTSKHCNARQLKKRRKHMLQNGFRTSAYRYHLKHLLEPAKARFE